MTNKVERYGMTRASAKVQDNPVKRVNGPWVRYADYAAIFAKLEAAEAERDAFRAVLEGAEYRDIDSVKTVEHGRALGQEVAAMTIEAMAQRDAALEALEKLQRDEWADRPDDLTPQVKSDFRSEGFFQRYDRAMVLVSNRHSKGALVSLVAFLLRGGDE